MTLKLDENQQKAVEHFEGPALVVAGPGSGKTTVIKERILHLIRKHNVDPEQILAIAFTNAAADEMTARLSNEPRLNQGSPKICTLHVFGKDLITDNPKQAGFTEAPHNIWDTNDIRQIAKEEKYRLQRTTNTALVAIYKFEGMTTGRCYIGQTTDPERREQEHRTHSSNRGLREALQKGDEKFEFKVIATVIGQKADDKETHEIRLHRNRAAVNLDQDTKKLENVKKRVPVSVYKIKSGITVKCWIGQSEEPEQSIEYYYNNSSDDDLRKAIENGNFEIITEKLPRDKASRRVVQEIEAHKNWAVFNRQDPLQARDSNRRRIEIFCEYFNVSYNEVIEHTEKFNDLIEKFKTMKDDIEKIKRQVDIGLFEPHKIADPVLRAFAKRYEDRKTEAKAIDFLDMLILSANMLEKYPELLQRYRKKYCYVFVDEFQDISPVDFRLMNLFPENLFAVGDDDQAIYGFRGGNSQIMQDKFGKQANVANYEITRNYRSTSSVVKHARSLILYNNPHRFSKNLRAENSVQSRVARIKTSPDTIENVLLSELLPIVTACETQFNENIPYLGNLLLQELTVPQKIGILARNWYEVNPIQSHLKSGLKNKGFQVCKYGSDDEEKRKMIMRRGEKEIEILNIHTAKGREWEKVILLVNTATYSRKVILPDERNDLEDERSLFYVAITRAKQELVVFDGGNCRFVPEFRNVRPIEILETIESEIKKELENISRQALETLKLKLKQELEEETTAVLRQSDELNSLRGNVTEGVS